MTPDDRVPAVDPTTENHPPTRHAVVLLVEDDDAVREFVRAALEQDGYAVAAVADADQALARFLADPAAFHLVLSDVMMPGRTGPELADELRRVRPDVRVLFMSAFVGGAHVRPVGAELLEKPFTVEQLLAAVARNLRSR